MVGKELNGEYSYKLARLLNFKSVVLGRDARPSSCELLSAFKQGLLDSGCKVIELVGVASSPLLYFAGLHLKTEAAVMITGSHNPLEYNGFKFMKNGKPFYGDDLRRILENPIIDAIGSYELIDLREEYTKAILKNLNITKKFKIAWECNNSGVGRILKNLEIPGEHLLLNASTDGVFANASPDPLIEKNLAQIQKVIIENKCDFGFAFDGDADRLVMIKANGEILTSDQLIYLLALSLKDDKKEIILDMKSSQILIEALKQKGFKVIFASGGHSIMKEAIVREDAVLAGEASGHFIINDSKYYPLDDALYVALRIIEYLQNNPIIELPLANIRKEFKIPIKKEDRDNIICKIQLLKDVIPTLGGIRKNYPDAWWLIRASNTESYILVKYEANDERMENKLLQELKEIINLPLSLT